jgi:hypothetical protein
MGDGEGGNDDDGEVETPDDPCELLDLDRRLRVGKNLRLSPGTPSMPHPARDASNTLHSGNFTMPMKPMSLIPLADFEKVNVPLYSRRNNKEIIGKKDDFRVNTAHVLKQVRRACLASLHQRAFSGIFIVTPSVQPHWSSVIEADVPSPILYMRVR